MDLMSNKGLGLRPRSWWIVSLISLTLLASLPPVSKANHDAKRLYDDLLRKNNYNKLIRPVGNSSEGLTVRLGLRLAQLIDVDERNEIITLNMWVIQEWEDYSLRWDPKEYGGVDMIYVPSKSIWLPDIVLYNNADGDYTVTLMTKATLNHFGKVVWEPPAIYKSHCDINVEFFPFDEQLCQLKFGSWTYDGTSVDLRHVWTESLELGETDPIERGLDVDDYYRSTEWDLVGIPAKKNVKYYPCCIEPYPDITFNISIRRKTLFYTINLLVPCISINLLTILTFYLPSDSGEKISLCITLLLSLSMFQLLLMELIPATSMKVPLLGKFILFTTVIVSLSVVVTVVTLNMNFRSNSTTVMPKRTRKLFLDILPRLLFMKSPLVESLREEREAAKKGVKEEETYWSEWEDPQNDRTNFGIDPRNDPGCRSPLDADPENAFTSDMYARPQENMYNQDPFNMHPNRGIRQPQYGNRYNDNNEYNVVGTTFLGGNELWRDNDVSVECPACSAKKSATSKFPLHIRKALEGIEFVEKHHKDDDDSKVVRDEWKFVALVIDRFLLWIYISMCCIGSASILLNAPMLYVNKEVL